MESQEQLSPLSNAVALAITAGMTINEFRVIVDREFLEQSLNATKGNRTKAAKKVGVHRNTMLRNIEELQIDARGISQKHRPYRYRKPMRSITAQTAERLA